MRRILEQLYPAIGELQPLRTAELVPPIKYRRLIYWVSSRGKGSLVGVLWAPGAVAHIHSHGHDGFGKVIEGQTEGTTFELEGTDTLKLVSRTTYHPRATLTFRGGQTVHAVRNITDRDAINVHFYEPEDDGPGLRFEPVGGTAFASLTEGETFQVTTAPDVLPALHLSDPYRDAAEAENSDDG